MAPVLACAQRVLPSGLGGEVRSTRGAPAFLRHEDLSFCLLHKGQNDASNHFTT